MSLDPRIQEELTVFEHVKAKVREAALRELDNLRPSAHNFNELRDQARHAADFDLPMLLDQLHIEHQLIHREQKSPRPELAAPYFGRIIIEEAGRVKTYLIGEVSFLDSDPVILDWKTAPLAKIFFQHKPGEEYEVELPSRIACGVLKDKITLGFQKGVLMEIRRSNFHARWENKQWIEPKAQESTQGFGKKRSHPSTLQIKSLLDPNQYRVLSTAHDEPLLVMGSAGSGKTTVALHRLALLPNHRKKVLVLVPEQGLLRLTRKILQELNLHHVEVFTYEEWCLSMAKKTLGPAFEARIHYEAQGEVVKFKRLSSILNVLPLVTQRRSEILRQKISAFLGRPIECPDLKTTHLKAWIENLKATWADNEAKQDFFSELEHSLKQFQFERRLLFGNKEFMSQFCTSSKQIDYVYRHTVAQMGDKESFSHVDSEYSIALDGADLRSEDTLSGTVDIEDYTVLLLLNYEYQKQQVDYYDHILIDEIQELSASELKLIGTFLKDSSITLAGDEVQQTTAGDAFPGFDQAFSHLGFEHYHREVLATIYRCSQQVVNFSRKILGQPTQVVSTKTDPGSILGNQYHSQAQILDELAEKINGLFQEEPFATVAILCKDYDSSSTFYNHLQSLLSCRHIQSGDFSFLPGLDISTVRDAKGLEFDYIIVPDLESYSETWDDRRLLHVAVTRCIEQLWILGVGVRAQKWLNLLDTPS